MKFRLIYTLLPFVFAFNLFPNRQSQAKPSPIFQPIIKEIETRLPSGLEMRLPATVPTSTQDATLYSFLPDEDSKLIFEFDDLKMEFFTVLIGDNSDCLEQKNPEDCLVAAVGVTEDPIESQAELDALLADSKEDIASDEFERGIEIDRGIEGFYLVYEELQLQSIIWRQGKMAHLLMSKKCPKGLASRRDRECISKRQLIEMAKSAANETAITGQNVPSDTAE
ncbi:conserved hypothetical protein [Hyella patelloides LEGE 07179]|uniref:Uncharacterized protein n=1 Tax=Hyella patelloides LEGE 07179 TaxID=945734 RepID=A0A563W0K0_9CYAN|nr:hypothetical protein [Hyella patelloides]VEP17190.1 conserved hypothetical protein [Hyella patelloides LEGE 07179]